MLKDVGEEKSGISRMLRKFYLVRGVSLFFLDGGD
jgi:hypothetical protein